MLKPYYITVHAEDGTELGREVLTARGKLRPFASGKTGWNASGKMVLANPDDTQNGTATQDRHQISVNFVRVGNPSEGQSVPA